MTRETVLLSEGFWRRIEPLIPVRPPRDGAAPNLRRPGAGRKPKDARTVFAAILVVLRTGCAWKALNKGRYGSASAIHRRFVEWERAGLFSKLWQAGLAESDEMQGVAWHWHSVETSSGTRRRVWRPAIARRRRKRPAG